MKAKDTAKRRSRASDRNSYARTAALAEAWADARHGYVEGWPLAADPGKRHWPSVEEAATRSKLLGLVALQTVRHRASREKWGEQQARSKESYLLAAKAESDRISKERGAQVVVQKASFDDDCFVTARGLLGKVIEGTANLRLTEPVTLPDGRSILVTSHRGALTLRALAMGLVAAQHAGRLSLGQSTDNLSVRGNIDGTADLDKVLKQLSVEALLEIERALASPENGTASERPAEPRRPDNMH